MDDQYRLGESCVATALVGKLAGADATHPFTIQDFAVWASSEVPTPQPTTTKAPSTQPTLSALPSPVPTTKPSPVIYDLPTDFQSLDMSVASHQYHNNCVSSHEQTY